MAKYISMLANGGQKIDVSIVKTIRNADGSEVSKEEINNFVNQKLGQMCIRDSFKRWRK